MRDVRPAGRRPGEGEPAPYPSGAARVRPRPLVLAIGACLGFMLLGGVLARPGWEAWYGELATPDFGAPRWFFALAGTAYYLLFGIALYRIQVRIPDAGPRRWCLGLTLAVMGVHEVWNALLPGLRSPLAGFVGLLAFLGLFLVLWGLLLRRERVSALLLLPYLLWAGYDVAWSYELWRLNVGL